jgi:hypothetical protein
LSERDNKNHYLFCGSIDDGWNNQGSGKAYNSNSAHHITVGATIWVLLCPFTTCPNAASNVKLVRRQARKTNMINPYVLAITLAHWKKWRLLGLYKVAFIFILTMTSYTRYSTTRVITGLSCALMTDDVY